jgi:hypothetical protein
MPKGWKRSFDELAVRFKSRFSGAAPDHVILFALSEVAVIDRLTALPNINGRFKRALLRRRSLKRQALENVALFDFFTNALAAMESFVFGAYCVGVELDPSLFNPSRNLWEIKPAITLACYHKRAPNSSFYQSLRACLHSKEYNSISAMRNVLCHRGMPGRYVELSTIAGSAPIADEWNLARWLGPRDLANGVPLRPVLDAKFLTVFQTWAKYQISVLSQDLALLV